MLKKSLYIRKSALKKLGLTKLPAEFETVIKNQPFYCITCVKGVKSQINYNLLTANIIVPAHFFEKKKLKKEQKKYQPVKSKGLVVSYDAMYSKYTGNNLFRTYLKGNYFFDEGNFISDFNLNYSEREKDLSD
ncbi:MAG: hypothetical protein Q9M89_04320 [Persephonella sp.]|nr:hypothetical protein [Persephonella sp.]